MLSRNPDEPYLGTRLAERLIDHIRVNDLTDGDFLPSEQEIAQTHGASMRVVRDALRQLSQQGVIRSQQGKRAEVTSLRPVAVRQYFKLLLHADDQALDDLLEFRTVLETAAAGMAAVHIDERGIVELSGVLDQIDRVEDGDVAARSELDLEFHAGIAQRSENAFLVAVADALHEALSYERTRNLEFTESSGGSHERSDGEHRELLQALAEHDSERASELMAAHLARVRSSMAASPGHHVAP